LPRPDIEARQVLEHRLALASATPASSLARVDEARLRRVVSAHFDVLWRFLRRLGIPESDVDDAVQEVILVLARKLDQVQAESERSFVLSTAFRVASGMRRQVKRRREVSEASLYERESPALDPEAAAEQRRLALLLAHVLEQLSLELRDVFVLYELEDFTMAEIASALGLPPGTVASRLRRGRETFERLAAQALADEGLA
jgi:RNA polymerase sigma-70 factor (ECF subfamily)